MNNKHLSLEERKVIETMLNEGKNFTEIAQKIDKDRTTISKEIRLRRLKKENFTYGSSYTTCKSTKICANSGTKICKQELCKDFIPSSCTLLEKPPYVCNSCEKRRYCRNNRYTYLANVANDDYLKELCNSRSGPRITKEESQKINKVIAPLLKEKKQSINHIFINHPDELYFSKTTFYSYVADNLFEFDNFDLRRKVKMKKRKNSPKRRTRTESVIRIGRTYRDYLDYMTSHPNSNVVQMDTVEGVKGGKVFLTLLFVRENFMLIYLLDKKNTECVTNIFTMFQNLLGDEKYHELFEVILTDNGSEFFYPMGIEISNKTSEVLSNIFYCDSEASYQKGDIEKNHEFIRYVLPKRSSFNQLTQDDAYLLASHINSTARICLGNKTPYDLTLQRVNAEIINNFGISKIQCDDVNLSSNLLKKTKITLTKI